MKQLLTQLLLFCLLHTQAQPALIPCTGQNINLGLYMKGLRAAGNSRVWLMVDSYRADYSLQTGLFLDAAAAEGLTVIIGAQTGTDMAAAAEVCDKYWSHKAVHRFNGKPVFSGYDRSKGTSAGFADEMARLGRKRGEYLIWVSIRGPTYEECPGLNFLCLK